MVPPTLTKQQLTATSNNSSSKAPSIVGNPIQAVVAATEVMDHHRWPMEAVATSAMSGTPVLILAR